MISDTFTEFAAPLMKKLGYPTLFCNSLEVADDGEITGNLRVFVYDEGPNIPTDELDKVFIKFYKVDKARTREYGGSGIGLSIVAASMAAHNKYYGVYNVEDGVVFYFDLDVIKQDGDEPGLLPENTEDNTTENVSEQ